jgi:hypothetical protein
MRAMVMVTTARQIQTIDVDGGIFVDANPRDNHFTNRDNR